MRKALILIVTVIFTVFTFSENEIYKKDIRNRLVIQAIGIDYKTEGTYTVTLQAIDTATTQSASAEGASQPPVRVYSLEGDTIYTAIKGVIEKEGKIPLYSQNRVIIIGKSITESKMDNVIDFFVRDVENGGTVFIAAAENTAGEILKAKNGDQYISAQTIEGSIKASDYDAKIFSTHLYELINRYNSGTKDFAMPLLALTEKGEEKSVEVAGAAIFNSTAYRELLSKDKTTYLNILCNRLESSAIAFQNEGNQVSLSIVKSSTKRGVRLEDGAPVFSVRVNMDADIAEISGGVSSAMTQKELSLIKATGEQFIETEIAHTLSQLYGEYNSDACGFARLLYIFHKDFYRKNEKNLDLVLQNSAFEVEVNLNIRRVGHEFISINP